MALIAVLLLAAAVQVVKSDAPLRSGGCGESDATVATLKAGAEVSVKFSLAGGAVPCFLVSAAVDGKTVDGYLPGALLSGADEFERHRRDAPTVAGSTAPPPPPPIPDGPVDSIPNPDLDRARALLAQNRPAEALAILEKYLQLAPRQPDLLAAAGYAAYRADRFADSIDYLKRSLALRDNPQVARLLAGIEREAAADRSKERKVGSRFMLRYDTAAADPAAASVILETLEREFSRLQQRLGCAAGERILTIVQSPAQFRGISGAPEWVGALYDGRIRVPLPPGGAVTPELRAIFAHEIVHACLANLGRWPSWLQEGLAQELSGEPLNSARQREVLDLGRAGKLPPIGKLSGAWSGMTAAQAAIAYGTARAGVAGYLARHGDTGIRNVLNNPQFLAAMAAEIDRTLAGKE